jgi:hypothetical protein
VTIIDAADVPALTPATIQTMRTALAARHELHVADRFEPAADVVVQTRACGIARRLSLAAEFERDS